MAKEAKTIGTAIEREDKNGKVYYDISLFEKNLQEEKPYNKGYVNLMLVEADKPTASGHTLLVKSRLYDEKEGLIYFGIKPEEAFVETFKRSKKMDDPTKTKENAQEEVRVINARIQEFSEDFKENYNPTQKYGVSQIVRDEAGNIQKTSSGSWQMQSIGSGDDAEVARQKMEERTGNTSQENNSKKFEKDYVAGIRQVTMPGKDGKTDWTKDVLWINVTEFEKQLEVRGRKNGQIDFAKRKEIDEKGNSHSGYMHINGDKFADISLIIGKATLAEVQKNASVNKENGVETVYASFDLKELSPDGKAMSFGKNDFLITQYDAETGDSKIIPDVHIRYAQPNRDEVKRDEAEKKEEKEKTAEPVAEKVEKEEKTEKKKTSKGRKKADKEQDLER